MVDLAQAAVWHRQVAALVAAADRAGVAEAELPALKARLAAQQQRFGEAAARTGGALPPLTPTPIEIAAAAPALGDLSAETAAEAMRTVSSTLDATDGILTTHLAPSGTPAGPLSTGPAVPGPAIPFRGPAGPATNTPATSTPAPVAYRPPVTSASQHPDNIVVPPTQRLASDAASAMAAANRARAVVARWPASVRNTLVYGAFASVVFLFNLILIGSGPAGPLLWGLACGMLFLPAFAWAAGWLAIGLLFRSPAGGPAVKRTPKLGALICLAANLMLCPGWLVINFFQ